jgi:GNAT superfamily N-acetyltransferase
VLSIEHAEALKEFVCATSGQPWTRDVQHVLQADVAELLLSDTEAPMGFVALADDELVGVVVCSAEPNDPEVMTIPALAVVKPWRRQGIGTQLKRLVLMYAVLHHHTLVVSTVDRRNVAMNALNKTRFSAESERNPDGDDKMLLTVVAVEPYFDDVS